MHILAQVYNTLLDKLSSLSTDKTSVAKGFSLGCAISFTPFVGFHALIALGTATLLKQNRTASLLGTLLGNPWTFPLIWWLDWRTGLLFLPHDLTPPDDFSYIFKETFSALITLDFNSFFRDIWPMYRVMLVGSAPYFLSIWLISPPILARFLQSKGAVK